MFLATSKSVKDMDGSLCDSGFFDTRFEMPTLDSGIRREILKSLFEKNKMEMDSKALSVDSVCSNSILERFYRTYQSGMLDLNMQISND